MTSKPQPNKRPTPKQVFTTMASALVTLSAVEAGISYLLGTHFSFKDLVVEVVTMTFPLTLGFAVVSLLVVAWMEEHFIGLGWLLLLVALVLCGAGYLGCLMSGNMNALLAQNASLVDRFDGQLSGILLVIWRASVYSVLSILGFYQVYGPTKFFEALIVGAVGPWVALWWVVRKYEQTEKKLSAETAE